MNLPKDIEDVLSKIDRDSDYTLLPRYDAAIDKYDHELKEVLREWQVRNDTEFDYGRSYQYTVALCDDPDAGAADQSRLCSAVKKAVEVDTMFVAISAVAPYVHFRFVRYTWEDNQLFEEWTQTPKSSVQEEAMTRVMNMLVKHGIRPIDSVLASTPVPDVETDLCDKGDATVADCLFYG